MLASNPAEPDTRTSYTSAVYLPYALPFEPFGAGDVPTTSTLFRVIQQVGICTQHLNSLFAVLLLLVLGVAPYIFIPGFKPATSTAVHLYTA